MTWVHGESTPSSGHLQQLSFVGRSTFEDAFYVSLAQGDTVLRAFEMGKQAVATSTSALVQKEHNKFLLLPKVLSKLENAL